MLHAGHRQLAFLGLFLALLAGTSRAGTGVDCREIPLANENTFDVSAVAFPDELSAGIPVDAVIRAVYFQRHDVFDETTEAGDNVLFGAVNSLHLRTSEATVANDLLFQAGDRYDEALLKESARVLRSRRYFHDARVIPVRVCGGEVDVLVITRDVWSLQPSVAFSRKGGRSTSSFAVRETNLFGLGKRLSVEQESGFERDSIKSIYDDPALFGSRVQLRLEHDDTNDGQQNAIGMERPFFSLDTRWSTGLRYESGELIEKLYQDTEPTTAFVHDRFLAETWFGASSGLQNGGVTRWLAGATVETSTFTTNILTDPAEPFPADRHYAYPWVEWRREKPRYETRRNFNSIAVTEDVNFGSAAFVRLGWSDTGFGAMGDNAVVGLGGYWNLARGKHHVLNLALSGSGYWNSDDGWQHAKGIADLEYHNVLSHWYSHYGHLRYEAGINMPVDQPLYSDGMTGLRGYPLHYLRGTRRSLLQLEQRFHTDWHPFRLFHVGFATFADAGQSWDSHGDSSFLADAGFGLRLASSRAYSGNILHIDLAFPLREKDGLPTCLLSVQIKETF